MPVSIRTLPTTTGNSYLSSSGYSSSSRYSNSSSSAPSSYTSTRFSYRPSGTSYVSSATSTSSYHRSTGDDTTSGTTGTNRFGVSRYTKSSLLDRDSASKPPTGSSSSSATVSRHRISDSRARDLSVDNYLKSSYNSSGYHSSSPSSTSASTKLSDSSYQNTKRQSYSSLARSVATSGADLYEQYSPSNYIPKVELSRSRSLSETSGGKLLDTTNNHINHHLHSSSVGLGSRASSRDRETSIDRTAGITSKVNKSSTSAATDKSVSCDRHHNNNHNRHNNNNLSCGSVAVNNTKTNQKPATNRVATTSSLANRNNNVQPVVGIVLGTACATKTTATASSHVNNSTSASCIKRNTSSTGTTLSLANRRSDHKSGSATNINVPTMITSHHRGNNTASPVSASDFYKLTGVNPLSVDTNFLESECKLARSQVSSESPNRLSYVGRNNNANKSLIYQPRSASANRSTTTTEDNINNNSGRTMNCLQKSPELLDDIKYIDSDDSERKHSPPISSKMASAKDYMKGLGNVNSGTANGTTTLPATISKKSVNDVTSNKYNTITSSSKSCHQQHHLQPNIHNHVPSSRHRNGSIPSSNSLSSSEPRNALVNGVERLDKDVSSVSPPPHISNGTGTSHNHSAAASTTSTPNKCVDKLLEKSKLTSDLNGGSVSYPFA